MITFLSGIAILILGYVFYGRFIDKRLFGSKSKYPTPAITHTDGVDFSPLKPWKIFIIQFLNIAGLGPIFGAILGAAYGPVAYIWIALGCVFMGGVHDYFSGMLSVRHNGRSMPNIISKYLSRPLFILMNIFMVWLLISIGSSFIVGPAELITSLTGTPKHIWIIVILAYYIIATILPIDEIIGHLYPFFGGVLLFMAIAVGSIMLVKCLHGELTLIELSKDSFRNFHNDPEHNILVPMLFIILSCGALSGFHSTQSPIMARCISDEKYGRSVFYGAMICEGIVAMIWATAAMAYFGGPDGLNAAAAAGKTPAIIVNEICNSWLGKFGALIAIIGVIICPITSGDTAFRSLRLILGEAFKVDQNKISFRLMTALPIFLLAGFICKLDFSTIWIYNGIGNQILAMFVLWTGAKYLSKQGAKHLFLSIPATFITFICISYFLCAPHKVGGLMVDPLISYIIAGAITLIAFSTFNAYVLRRQKSLLIKRRG